MNRLLEVFMVFCMSLFVLVRETRSNDHTEVFRVVVMMAVQWWILVPTARTRYLWSKMHKNGVYRKETEYHICFTILFHSSESGVPSQPDRTPPFVGFLSVNLRVLHECLVLQSVSLFWVVFRMREFCSKCSHSCSKGLIVPTDSFAYDITHCSHPNAPILFFQLSSHSYSVLATHFPKDPWVKAHEIFRSPVILPPSPFFVSCALAGSPFGCQ